MAIPPTLLYISFYQHNSNFLLQVLHNYLFHKVFIVSYIPPLSFPLFSNLTKKILEEISQDEHERYLAELREKYILDQNNIEATGYDKGLKQGKKEIAKEMIKEKMSLEVISKITKISKEELQEIKKEI